MNSLNEEDLKDQKGIRQALIGSFPKIKQGLSFDIDIFGTSKHFGDKFNTRVLECKKKRSKGKTPFTPP